MKREPKVRPDGKCALKGCGKKLPPLALRDGDPFHTTICARSFHGVVFHSDERKIPGRRSMVE